MIKIDLITGFLGSGKTTFIKKYASYLVGMGEKIGILENDHGAVNVDMMLLQELCSEKCDLEMVSGGGDKDCHRRRFKTKLIAMGMSGYNRVLVEPSGIFDVDDFFDVLYEEPLSDWYEIGNIFAIVDAKLSKHSVEQADFLLASQLANVGRVVLSKCDRATQEDIATTISYINNALAKYKCDRRFELNDDAESVIYKNWQDFSDEDYIKLSKSGYKLWDYVKVQDTEKYFSTIYIMNKKIEVSMIREKIANIFMDACCGDILRIKGFVSYIDGENISWIEINATYDEISIEPIDRGQEVLIVIGRNMQQARIENYFD